MHAELETHHFVNNSIKKCKVFFPSTLKLKMPQIIQIQKLQWLGLLRESLWYNAWCKFYHLIFNLWMLKLTWFCWTVVWSECFFIVFILCVWFSFNRMVLKRDLDLCINDPKVKCLSCCLTERGTLNTYLIKAPSCSLSFIWCLTLFIMTFMSESILASVRVKVFSRN